jgi:uncharacterized protein (DUF1810 family)
VSRPDPLSRFVDAQDADDTFQTALAELRAGRKRGHWIWFVFPQLAGLGTSHMARTYAIADHDEAVAYLRHPVLCSRLRDVTEAAASHVARGVHLDDLMGSSIDATKLVSSLTLFTHVAGRLRPAAEDEAPAAIVEAGNAILAAAATQGYPPCVHTLDRLRG